VFHGIIWHDKRLTVDILTELIFLKSIKHLTIEHYLCGTGPDTKDSRHIGSSPLTGLTFGEMSMLGEKLLGKLLQYPRALERLSCTIRCSFDTETTSFGSISPSAIRQVLSHTNESLQELVITERWSSRRSPDHDHTHVDLKSFSRLKKYVVPAVLFFHTHNTDPS
jgi:hypothetical protein